MFFESLFVKVACWLLLLVGLTGLLINLVGSLSVSWDFIAVKLSCIALEHTSLTLSFSIFMTIKSCIILLVMS